MTRNTKRFHNTFLLLLIAALIPASAVLFTLPAEAHLPHAVTPNDPNEPVIDPVVGLACTWSIYNSVVSVQDGCCLHEGDDLLRRNYVEYQCTSTSSGLEWQPIGDWCGYALCHG